MLGHIVDKFKITNINQATYKLKDILNHYQQENPGKEKPTSTVEVENTVEIIYHHILSAQNYRRVVTDCRHFAYLLAEIGVFWGHNCLTIQCRPNYLGNTGANHHVVHDKTEDVYLDPSVYNWHYNGTKWINDPYPLMTNVPITELNCITN